VTGAPAPAAPPAHPLAGNGVALVRERALAADLQGALERVYRLERIADVGDFVRDAAWEAPEGGEARDSVGRGARESVLVRAADDGALEVVVQLPRLDDDASLDGFCQIIEGVSHFVYLVERARAGRTTTQLELEVQAEVDKWLILAASMRRFDAERSADLRASLYERVVFESDAASEAGERYRVANDVAHAFVRRLERRYVPARRFAEMRADLRRFFHEGQEEKLRLAR
jgi:hypothetical protein